MKFIVNFECTASELNRERRGYFDAFAKLDNIRLSNFEETEIGTSDRIFASNEVVLCPDPPQTLIPENLVELQCPTICFQIDTFSKPAWRALWSTLFDYVFVFHPGFDSYFLKYGHTRVFVLPHAVAAPSYSRTIVEGRNIEIAWAGRIDGPLYGTRCRLLPQLAARYKMNAWQGSYTESEVPELYRTARAVVNIGRDDYPQDANLRCFEAMASGALLVTSLPTELELLGFKNQVHFVGYSSESELFRIIDSFLSDEFRRSQVAEAGRRLVLREHTYNARAQTVLQIVERDAGILFAPARSWKSGRVAFVYLHYHCKRVHFAEAKKRFIELLRGSPLWALWALPLLVRCWQHHRAKRSQSARAAQ